MQIAYRYMYYRLPLVNTLSVGNILFKGGACVALYSERSIYMSSPMKFLFSSKNNIQLEEKRVKNRNTHETNYTTQPLAHLTNPPSTLDSIAWHKL